jgi:4,5-DOPA dioxygenase extradiol
MPAGAMPAGDGDSAMTQPAIFVSHGAPTLPLDDVAARNFLSGLGTRIDAAFGRPSAILVASAHWETAAPEVSAPAANETIHDFGGFPRALYEMRYPAPPAPDVAAAAVSLLRTAGMRATIDLERGLDHGAWVPLMLMYPGADIPVAQLSVQTHLGPEHHLRLGQAIAALREEGVLVLGSGSYTHNLMELRGLRQQGITSEPDWVRGFADWTDAALAENRVDDLLAYRRLAPFGARNHPTEEHLLPLFVAMGAGGGATAEHLHASVTHAALRMDVFGFGTEKLGATALAA